MMAAMPPFVVRHQNWRSAPGSGLVGGDDLEVEFKDFLEPLEFNLGRKSFHRNLIDGKHRQLRYPCICT